MNPISLRLMVLIGVVVSGHALAGERMRESSLGFGKSRLLSVEQVRLCRDCGPGFQSAPGAASCIRVFGAVRVEIDGRSKTR